MPEVKSVFRFEKTVAPTIRHLVDSGDVDVVVVVVQDDVINDAVSLLYIHICCHDDCRGVMVRIRSD